MIAALLLGREGSIGFPGKNTYPVLGKPLMVYPLLAAKNAQHVNKIYVSTDSPTIKKIGKEYGVRSLNGLRNCVHPRHWASMLLSMVTMSYRISMNIILS